MYYNSNMFYNYLLTTHTLKIIIEITLLENFKNGEL